MEFHRLRYFVAVVEEKSIHAGARRLMMAQPQLSQAIRQLEREVGTPLLVRSPRGVLPTPAGELLLHHAYDILRRVDGALETVRGGSTLPVVNLGLVAGPVAAAELTTPIVSAFRWRFPHLQLRLTELTFADQVEALVEGRVDVAIARPPYFDDRIELVPLFSEPRLLCLNVAHPLAEADELTLSDVLKQPMFELDAPRRWNDFWLLNDVRDEPAELVEAPRPRDLTEWGTALEAATARTNAVMLMGASAWRIGRYASTLRALPVRDVARSEVAVAYRRDERREHVLQLATFAREVVEELIALVPDGHLLEL